MLPLSIVLRGAGVILIAIQTNCSGACDASEPRPEQLRTDRRLFSSQGSPNQIEQVAYRRIEVIARILTVIKIVVGFIGK